MIDKTITQIEREKMKIAKGKEAIEVMHKKLEIRADRIRRVERNYERTWLKPDGTPLADLELRVPDLYWEPTTWTGYGPIAYWSTIQTEELGFNENYSSPANQNRTDILNKASEEKSKFNWSYHRRQLHRKTFEKNIQSAVTNLRRYIARIKDSDDWLDKWHYKRDKPLLDDWEIQLTEHFNTNYGKFIPLKAPYQAREITSKQLQEYLGKMEERNASERLKGGQQ